MTFNIDNNAYLSLKYFCHSEKTGARGFNLNVEELNIEQKRTMLTMPFCVGQFTQKKCNCKKYI